MKHRQLELALDTPLEKEGPANPFHIIDERPWELHTARAQGAASNANTLRRMMNRCSKETQGNMAAARELLEIRLAESRERYERACKKRTASISPLPAPAPKDAL